MKKKILFEDENRINNLKNRVSNQQPVLQEIVDEYNSLELGESLTESLLRQLIKNPTGFVKQVVMDKLPEKDSNGLTINKNEAIKQIEMPDLSQLERLTRQVDNNTLHLFDLNDGQITVNADKLENEQEKYRVYARNDEEIQHYNKLKQLEALLNELNEDARFIKTSDVGGTSFDIKQYFTYRMGRLELLPEGFKKFMSNLKTPKKTEEYG